MPKKKSNSSAEKPISKTKFVLDLPATTSAEDVVAKAAASGLTLSKAYVYTIRANSKRAAKKGRARASSGAAAPSASSSASAPKAASARSGRGDSLDIQFVNFIAEIGLVRAEELMKNVRAKFRSAAI